MIGLLQRVTEARVTVGAETVGEISAGMLVLVCAQPGDTPAQAGRLLDRLLGYRVFADESGRMNLSLRDTRGGLLLVPQFTLAADTRSGTRPGFSTAMAPGQARVLFDSLVDQARQSWPAVATGRFGADMRVSLVNDGPVTFWLEVQPPGPLAVTPDA